MQRNNTSESILI